MRVWQLFNGANTNDPYKFTGKERDTESGNDYFGASTTPAAWEIPQPDPSGLSRRRGRRWILDHGCRGLRSVAS